MTAAPRVSILRDCFPVPVLGLPVPTDERPPPWYKGLLNRFGKAAQSAWTNETRFDLTPEQMQAEAWDDGGLDGYKTDERTFVHVYQGIVYSREMNQWVARFGPPPGVSFGDTPFLDFTHPECLTMFRVFHSVGIKPSQCAKALSAFDAKLDREVAALSYHP